MPHAFDVAKGDTFVFIRVYSCLFVVEKNIGGIWGSETICWGSEDLHRGSEDKILGSERQIFGSFEQIFGSLEQFSDF